jgi:hypothetical protein
MRRIHDLPAALRRAALPSAVLLLATALDAGAARADFQVRSPIVDYLEWEFEHNGSVTFDKKKSGLNNDQSYTFSLGYGPLPWWGVEIEGETEAAPGRNLQYNATTLENMFQLTPQGKYWADLGFFLEYSQAAQRGSPNEITFGPVVQKEAPGFGSIGSLHTLNLLFSKELGPNRSDDTGFGFAWQSRLAVSPLFEPGIEYYADVANIQAPGKLADQQHRLGPMFAGALSLAPYGKVKYELGYLFGVTRVTERGAVRWKFEYELNF